MVWLAGWIHKMRCIRYGEKCKTSAPNIRRKKLETLCRYCPTTTHIKRTRIKNSRVRVSTLANEFSLALRPLFLLFPLECFSNLNACGEIRIYVVLARLFWCYRTFAFAKRMCMHRQIDRYRQREMWKMVSVHMLIRSVCAFLEHVCEQETLVSIRHSNPTCWVIVVVVVAAVVVDVGCPLSLPSLLLSPLWRVLATTAFRYHIHKYTHKLTHNFSLCVKMDVFLLSRNFCIRRIHARSIKFSHIYTPTSCSWLYVLFFSVFIRIYIEF